MQQQQQQQQESSSSRGGLRNTGGGAGGGGGGVIVEVQGGHIVRATGRKDRHSKVCTAKGPRDRRVRLSAHTAIQFYDVQDRLGYDRPSKAVDWLIKKAKASIDELAELPAWNPTTGSISTNTLCASLSSSAQQEQHQVGDYAIQQHQHEQIESGSGANTRNNGNSQSFIPSSLDSDAIADTIKSFFPMGASNDHHQHHHHQAAPSNQIHFHQSYTPDLLSSTNTSSHNQDLRLSLHSFQDPMLIQSHHHQHQHHHNHQGEGHGIFSSGNALGFDTSPSAGWNEHHHQQQQQPGEMGRFQRMIAWNGGGADTGPDGGGGGGGGSGFMFNTPQSPPQQQQQQQQPFLQQLFGQSQFFSQRGPLQSSNTSSIRAWIDSPLSNHQQLHNHHHDSTSIHPSTMSGIGGYTAGDFSGFRIPARIQGDQEQEERGNGISNKPPPPSSASSISRH